VKKLLLGLFSVLVFAKMNPLVTKGESITDIGNTHSRYIEVPLERISYTPSISFVDNILIYSDREITEANCDIDLLNKESCPLDRAECDAKAEYTQGSSTKGTGIIPCSILHPNAYWSASLKKCILDGSYAGICSSGYTYSAATNKCVKTTSYNTTYTNASLNITVNNAGERWRFRNAYKTVALASGATYSNENFVDSGYYIGSSYFNNDYYSYISNHKRAFSFTQHFYKEGYYTYSTPCYNWVTGCRVWHPAVTTNLLYDVPVGGYSWWYKSTEDWLSSFSDENGIRMGSSGQTAFLFYRDPYPVQFTFNYDKPTCKSGDTLYYSNGVPKCRTTVSVTPQCNKTYFSTYSSGKCLGDRQYYTFYTYQCPTDLNDYDNTWSVLNAGGDCGAYNLQYDANSDGLKDHCNWQTPPTDNCKRVSYECPLDPTKVCAEGVKSGSGDTVEKDRYELLVNPGHFTGEYKALEYGQLRDYECSSQLNKDCPQALNTIYGQGNKLCFVNRSGQEGCFEAVGEDRECLFDGFINEDGIDGLPLFSFLNSPDEVIAEGVAKEDNDSPTRISLDFQEGLREAYPLQQIKYEAVLGDKITVDFWLNWSGNSDGMPIGFEFYDLWFSKIADTGKYALGFNTARSDVYGIADAGFMANGWHKITAVFTHGDVTQNKLYIDGVQATLAQRRSTHTVPEQSNADITKMMHLSGWSGDTSSALDAKIAGLNVYEGELDSQTVSALYEVDGQYGSAGITALSAQGNTINAYNRLGMVLGTINSSCRISGKVGKLDIPSDVSSPMIVAAKTVGDKISFWDSYMKRGDIGFLEIIKHVDESSYLDGYRHEHESISEMREKGFTAFVSPGNGKTYGVMEKKTPWTQCLNLLNGTPFVPAERSTDTPLANETIDMLSFYIGGIHGDNCIVETLGDKDNSHSTWAKKRVVEQGVSAYFCSPWSCVGHQCGYAACSEGFTGTTLKAKDMASLTTTTCLEQKCDKNNDYYRYCGSPFGCDLNDYTITQTDDGKCKKATCEGDDLFDPDTGTCEKIDCKYIIMDGKCYKKTY